MAIDRGQLTREHKGQPIRQGWLEAPFDLLVIMIMSKAISSKIAPAHRSQAKLREGYKISQAGSKSNNSG